MRLPPSAAVTIRLATDADMDAVAVIYAHHVLHGRASFETDPPGAAEMRRRRAEVVGKGLPYFVAVQSPPGRPGAGTGQPGDGGADAGQSRDAGADPGRRDDIGADPGQPHGARAAQPDDIGADAGQPRDAGADAGPAGEILGYAYASPYRPRAAYANTVENSVYLRPDAVGRGIGRRLLAALVAACEQCGLRQMVAVVGDSANHASIRLHEKLGFRRVGVLRDVGYKHGVWLDSVLLQRSLGPGGSAPPGRADG